MLKDRQTDVPTTSIICSKFGTDGNLKLPKMML